VLFDRLFPKFVLKPSSFHDVKDVY